MELWLGARLSSDGDFAQNIIAAAHAAGFSRQELGAAYNALMAETLENGVWQLNAARRSYWRNFALLNNTKPAPAAERPAFSANEVQAAVLRERARCEGILGCEAAKGRTALAQHYAFRTGDALADVVKALASMPLEASLQKAASPLPKPAAVPVAPPAPREETEADVVARIMSAGKAPASAAKAKHETAADVYARRNRERQAAIEGKYGGAPRTR